MEKFRPSASFAENVNCVSSVISPTTMSMVDQNQLINIGVSAAACPPTSNAVASHGTMEVEAKPDMPGTEESVTQKLEAAISLDAKQRIDGLLADIRKLDDKQKLWLYLQLPSSKPEQDGPCKSSSSPMLSNCHMEQLTAMNWVRTHIEENADTSLPKKEVYEEYRSFCENSCHAPLSAADFGKIIKNVFPAVQARRLGTRGNSRYCYSGMRKKLELSAPSLPPLDAPTIKHGVDSFQNPCPSCPTSLVNLEDDHLQVAASQVICEWASGVTSKNFANSLQLAQHLTSNKLVSRSSKSILIIQSHMGEGHRLDLTPEMRHRETNYHLKQTLQYRQEIRKKQAEENQQRLQEGASPGAGASANASASKVISAGSPEEDPAQIARMDKATQLEQKDVPVLKDIAPHSVGLLENGESSTSTESSLSSSSVSAGDGANAASKESPSKRRFAPIQPKTPVRDTSGSLVLLSPSAKNVNGQQMQLVVVNGQKVIPCISKLGNHQQMNVILQGQNVCMSPMQTVTAVGNQTPVNVVGSPVVGNTVLSSPVMPANSIQNAIKGRQVVLVGNPMKQVRGVSGGLQTVTNSNAAIRQNQGQAVTPNQVAVVAPAAAPQPLSVVSTSNVACQKTVLSSQGITYNTGTSNVRSQTMTPLYLEKAASASAPTLTSPVNVMAHNVGPQTTKLTSPANVIVRTATSSIVHIPNSQSVVTSELSPMTTSVTFATQPMKLLSSVAVIGSDAFQGNCVLSSASQSGVELNKSVTPQLAFSNHMINVNKMDKGRLTKSGLALSSDAGRSVSCGSKSSLLQNSGGKTVASLLKSAQASSLLAATKASTSSTAVDNSSNLVFAQVQMPAPNQPNNSKMQHFVIQTAAEDTGSAAVLGDRNALTQSGIGRIVVSAKELASLQQRGVLSNLLPPDQGSGRGSNRKGLSLQPGNLEDAGVYSQLLTQPSVSLLTDNDQSSNQMLMVSGMSAATMLPHKSKAGETQPLNQLPQTHATVAITNDNQMATMDNLPGGLQLKQVARVPQISHIQTSQPKMLERLLTLENLSYNITTANSEMRSARSVPTTPIAELQSPPPHMMRAQSAAIPMHQGGDSVPPSPSDGKSFAFTPINMIEVDGEDSPLKPKHKPKPTHPDMRNVVNYSLTNSEIQDGAHDGNLAGKGKGKRPQQPEFATPTRKRRPSSSSKRLAAASPSAVQFQQHMHPNGTSRASHQLTGQRPTFYVQNANQAPSQVSLAGGNIQLNTSFLTGGAQNQQATAQRRRNPSGPACSSMNMQSQQEIEAELMSLLNANTPNLQAMLAANNRALQNRSQSVPLPEQAANRFTRFQLPTQPELVPNQNAAVTVQPPAASSQFQVILSADQLRQLQDPPATSFAAKRNLSHELLNLDVTEEDFAPETLLNTEMNSGPNLQTVSSLNDSTWSATEPETSMAHDSNVQTQMPDFSLKYSEIADQQNGNSSPTENQSLLQAQAFNDTSNSTASSISDGLIVDLTAKAFEDFENEGFDLPPTPWQMASSNPSLSTLECGM